MTVTLQQVAEAAGVSISTASRALSTPERVAQATRLRVKAAADELGYQLNTAASALRRGRRSALGILVPDLANPYFSELVKGAQARARAIGQALYIADSDEDPRSEASLMTELLAQTDGAILCSPRATIPEHTGSPLVVVNATSDQHTSLVADDSAGAHRALEHLAALGHRRVVYVGGPATAWSDRSRRAALREAAG
ncbi:MAG: LacI family DNA-binding transcriptional regulator, partial [Mycetocola sp.]